jgi:SAM-dependent methyltransferase
VGVDSSPEQVRAAQKLGLDARVVSGEELPFAGEFDAVFSNAALHWMKRADAVIAGVYRALGPGGRFVGELGGHGCVGRIRAALVAALARRGVDGEACVPWYFPTPDDYATRLEKAGFRVGSMALFPRPTPLPGAMVDWLETFGESFAGALPAESRRAYFLEVERALAPACATPPERGPQTTCASASRRRSRGKAARRNRASSRAVSRGSAIVRYGQHQYAPPTPSREASVHPSSGQAFAPQVPSTVTSQ